MSALWYHPRTSMLWYHWWLENFMAFYREWFCQVFTVIKKVYTYIYTCMHAYNLDNYVVFCCFMLPINNNTIGHNCSLLWQTTLICTKFDASSTCRIWNRSTVMTSSSYTTAYRDDSVCYGQLSLHWSTSKCIIQTTTHYYSVIVRHQTSSCLRSPISSLSSVHCEFIPVSCHRLAMSLTDVCVFIVSRTQCFSSQIYSIW